MYATKNSEFHMRACLGELCRSDVTGLVRLSVGWLEKLQNRNRFGALIGLQPVGFGSF